MAAIAIPSMVCTQELVESSKSMGTTVGCSLWVFRERWMLEVVRVEVVGCYGGVSISSSCWDVRSSGTAVMVW